MGVRNGTLPPAIPRHSHLPKRRQGKNREVKRAIPCDRFWELYVHSSFQFLVNLDVQPVQKLEVRSSRRPRGGGGEEQE